jgi:hypothetical protein
MYHHAPMLIKLKLATFYSIQSNNLLVNCYYLIRLIHVRLHVYLSYPDLM